MAWPVRWGDLLVGLALIDGSSPTYMSGSGIFRHLWCLLAFGMDV